MSRFKLFRHLTMLSALLCFVVNGWGQSTANYAFTTNTTGSLALDVNGNAIDMSAGVTTVAGASIDNAGPFAASIGFNFIFMGTSYDQINTSGNGVFRLSNIASPVTISASLYASGTTASQALIAPFARDLSTSTTGSILAKTIGTAPNRCFVLQYTNMLIDWNSTTPNGTYQARLYESTGIIEFVYGSMSVGSAGGTTGYSLGFSTNTTANTFASITTSTNTVSTSTVSTNTYTAGSAIPNLNSSVDGSRRVYRFTPPSNTPSNPTSLTFTAVTATTETPNWVDNSLGESFFTVTRANDAGFTTGVVVTNVASTTSAGTGTTYTLAQTGLTPGTTYYYKIQAANEAGIVGSGLTGSQATTSAATYYYVGAATGSDFSTAASWNTNPAGGGTTRTVAATTDILIIDGIGTTNTAGGITIAMAASQSLGALQITNSTPVTIQSSAATQRILTLTGSVGDEFSISASSSVLLTNITNSVSIVFASGIGMTGTIAGTLTVAGASGTATSATANSFLTTGGTGTIVTVSSTGVINNTATTNITTNGNVTGSLTSLIFSNGSQYNVSGATTAAPWIPLATWDATSTLTISGLTTSTASATNNVQSFGNFVFNCPALTSTLSFFTTSTTAVIKGDLTITAGTTGGTGIFRALTTGTLTVNGNVNVLQGRLQSASGAGTFIVLGNTTNSTNGILEINGGTYSQRGTTFTNNGILTGVAGSVRLQFFTVAAQTFAGSGTVLTNIGGLTVENGGLTITHTNQIPTLRVNLFAGTITGSAKLTMGTGAALTVTTQVGAAGLLTPAGNFDAIPTFNLGTGLYNVIYQQESVARTTGFEIPSTRSINALTLSNSNGLTIAGGALSTAALTFGAGCGNITTNSSNVLTITGTGTTAITRTSTTAYVNGPLELTLPVSLATGSTYLFPIGKTSIYPFELVNPTTNAGGTVIVRSEVFDGNSGGTAGNMIATLSTSRYWATSVSSGSGNLINTNIRLTDISTSGFDAIANSATLTGAYDLVGGATSTITSTNILSTSPLTSLSGFYLMGAKTAAVLSTPSISPTGNQCTNVSRAISILITPGGGAVTSVNLNYSINGTAQTAIVMSNSTNNGGLNADTWTATLPTVTPVNASITWSVTATDVNSLTSTINGTGYQDAPNSGITASATATPSTICDGSNSSLSLSFTPSFYFTEGFEGITFPPSNWTLINGGSGNNWASGTGYVCSGSKSMQYSYNSSNAANTWMITPVQNLIAGNTYYISFNYKAYGSSTSPEKLKVTVGSSNTILAQTITLLDLTSISNSSCNSANITYTPSVSGTYYFGFNCYSPANYWSLGVDDITISTIQGSAPTPSAYSWSNGSTVIGTTNPLSTPIISGLTYTGTATVNGCQMTASVTPTVNPLPTAPTATNSSQCGAGIPTASVADNNSYTSPTFKWYSAATGGTLLQTSTSATYTSSISTTTTFYVAVVGTNTCESTRTAVTVTVSQPDAISATTSSAAICLGQTITLTAANTAASPTQNYSYSWVCATSGSGATSANTNNPASVTPTAAGSYTYTATGTDGACSAVNTVAVTVNANPAITSATASPASVCSGSSVSLSAASISASSGTSTIGTGTTTEFTYSIFRHGFGNGDYRHQLLYSASELTAAGLVAGQLTSLAFNITTLGSTAYTNYNISLANVSATSVSTTFNTSTTTQVYLATAFTLASGVNTFNFGTGAGSSLFTWDGTSSILVNICYTVSAASSTSYVQSSTTSFVSNNQLLGSAGACSATTATGTSTSRPNATFGGQVGTNNTVNFSWSWNSTPGLLTSTGTTTETNTSSTATTKTYTVTATNATTGCTNTATTSAIAINPVPATPSANSTSICGPQNATCSVTGSGTVGNTFKWYTVSTGGTAISGQTAATLSAYPISTETTLYASEANANCESARVAVIQMFTTPPSVTASASSATICAGTSTTLSATSANTGYTYIWNNSGGSGSSVTVSPSATTTYTVTATDASNGTNNGCSTTATTTVTVNPIPTNVTANSSNAAICNGSTVNLTSSASNLVLLSPTGDGGFETGSTFAENNWLTAATGNNLWYVGNAVVSSGSRSAYISTNTSNGGAAGYNKGTARVSHLYRDVTFPSGATNITLSFNWQGVGEGSVDYTAVYLVSTSVTPSAGTALSSGQIGGILNGQSTWQISSNNLNSNLAGTTQRLVFSWINDGSLGTDPAGVIDNVSITYTTPLTYSWTSSPSGFTSTSQNPTGVSPTQNTTYTVTATNTAGCSSSANVTITVNQPTLTWTGATSTDPTVATNWNPVALPCPVSDITVPGGLTNYPIYPTTLTISSGGSYTLQAGAQLTVTGTLTNNGTFTLQDGATFIQGTVGSIAGTGTYTVEKALTDNLNPWSNTSGRFWYMGVPLRNVVRSSYGTPGATSNRVWSYTEATKQYTPLDDASTLLSAGTGYVHRRTTNETLIFSASGENNGLLGSDYSVSGLTKNAGYTAGVHLVSNPYMGFLDWNAVYNASTNIDPTFYIRSYNATNNDINALISYNGSTSQLVSNASSVTLANNGDFRYIAPMQSIWVKVGAAAPTGTINMTRSMLSHQTGNALKSSTVFPTLARVNVVDGDRFDQLLVYMNSDMTNEVDQYDSEKLPVSGAVQVYTMASNKKLVMNGLKNNKKKVSVPLYLELPASKSYTLQLADYVLEDGLILLEDKQEGTMQDFTLLGNYTFYANSGQLHNRFVLHFILPNAELTTQGPSNSWVGSETSYTDGGNVAITNDSRGNIEITVDQVEEQKVEGNVTVTDMNGKEVYKGQLDGITTAVSLNVPAGIYYLTVQSGTLFEKKKVFIQD